ncbi:MAG TPA: hypothetical protein VN798_20565 [Pseudomonas sp.]|nr:hypothetical protein [Pseudomonas sp.]
MPDLMRSPAAVNSQHAVYLMQRGIGITTASRQIASKLTPTACGQNQAQTHATLI